ncbi:Alpha/Beta hydrolase protein [Gongronella butleri]|nr:Alpha/Beta hydrolase protein [Gongronella butleri]
MVRSAFLSCLWMVASIVSAQNLVSEDYRVTNLPGVSVKELPFEQYAGHILVSTAHDANIFFWKIDPVTDAHSNKLIIWLNGGPGCSSMDGLFMENGPYRVDKDLNLKINKGAWNQFATVVYVDQPVGTGFSVSDGGGYMRGMDQVAEEFTVFMEKLFEIFPEMQEQELYLAGESFAGTYIPYFAERILKLNREGKTNYNLQGLAIGNGWISPVHQYEAYYQFGVAMNLFSNESLHVAQNHLASCREKLKKSSTVHVDGCETILDALLEGTRDSYPPKNEYQESCINMYDIRLRNESFPSCGMEWPYDLTDVKRYLRLPSLVEDIHAEKKGLGWDECDRAVSVALSGDKSKPSYDLLPGILKETRLLLFSGEYDLICNYLGTEYMIGNMTWNGETGFQDAPRLDWVIGDATVGYYTESRNLTYVLIKDGSHMVPYDKPVETLDMINRFMAVGDGKVNGVPSYVGATAPAAQGGNGTEPPVQENEELEKPMDGDKQDKDNEGATDEQEDKDEEEDQAGSGTNNGGVTQHLKSKGSYGALILLMAVVIIGCCWYRSKNAADDADTKPSAGFIARIKEWLARREHRRGAHQLRLEDQDESNELDELVIEGPTLFAAEDHDSDLDDAPPRRTAAHRAASSSPVPSNRFAIVEDDDDPMDDFDEWDDYDDDATLTTQKAKDH